DESGGVVDHVLKSGKRNLTEGYNTLYIVDTQMLSYTETNFDVLQKEKITRNYKSLTYSYTIKKGMSLGLLLHFMPISAINEARTELTSGIHRVDINEKEIFANNVARIATMVSRDVIDEYTTTDIKIRKVNSEIKMKLIANLKKIKYPKKVVNADGKIEVKKGEYVTILDFIDIVNVSLKLGDLPEAKKKMIGIINDLNADKQDLTNKLEIAKVIKREQMITSAKHAKAENDNIAKILKTNPKFVKYQRLEDLESLLSQDNKDNDLEFIFAPANMTSGELTDVMRSTHN
ncbi:MAG: hypothetical protein U9Q66_00980, partial [Patescibacteria group bacterium]|nr:hypothetical protein [Patescibacteria group bacterium]